MTEPLKAWSWSTLEMYEQCPYKFKRMKLDKMPMKPSEALLRGRREHKKAEDYLKRDSDTLPTIKSPRLVARFEALRELNPVVEKKWAMDASWAPSGWFKDPATWVRVIPDAFKVEGSTALVIDHKTGKRYPDKHQYQGELQGMALMFHFPEVDEVDSRMWYLDGAAKDITEKGEKRAAEEAHWTVRRADLPVLVQIWQRRVEPMFNDRHWAKKPSYLCRFCDLSRANGGECEFS